MREADKRGEQLGLSDEELAFYDALQASGSVAQVLSEPTLKRIAQEIVQTVRRNITIDWARRENVRAHLRRLVKRILRKHGYPAEQYEQVAETVLEQAQLLQTSGQPPKGKCLRDMIATCESGRHKTCPYKVGVAAPP
jgi:type I restriction enzyme, R subunit